MREQIAALRIFSRDEFKQSEMAKRFTDPRVKYLIGDVRSRDRLTRAFTGADIVVHAAALKQVPSCAYNPIEAKRTNIDGAQNVIDAAIDTRVGRVMALSTDKACAPSTLYGATKAVAEHLFLNADAYVGAGRTRFSLVRYGNVAGSRGSLLPLLLEQRQTGSVTLTDPAMTRFWISLGDATAFIKRRIEEMRGGEIFIPILPSVWVTDVIAAIAPGCVVQNIGRRAGEKRSELLVSGDEAPQVLRLRSPVSDDTYYVLELGRVAGSEFVYGSSTNETFLTVEQIRDRYMAAIAEAA